MKLVLGQMFGVKTQNIEPRYQCGNYSVIKNVYQTRKDFKLEKYLEINDLENLNSKKVKNCINANNYNLRFNHREPQNTI